MTTDSASASGTPDDAVGPSATDGTVGSAFRSREAAGSRRAIALETGRETVASLRGALWQALARPTASDVAIIVATLAIGIAIGSRLVGPELAALAMAAGLGAAVATRLLASRRPIVRGFGGVVAVPVAVLVSSPALLAGALALSSSGVGLFAGLAVWALVVAALAAGLVSWERLGDGGVRRAATGTTLTVLGVIGVVVIRILPDSGAREHAGAAAMDLLGVAGDVLVAAEGSWAVVSFAGLLLVTAFASSRTLGYLPVERLVPPDRRGRVAEVIARVRRGCSLLTRAALALGIAAVVAPLAIQEIASMPLSPAALRTVLPAPAGDALAALVTASELRVALGAVFLLVLGVALLEWTRRLLGANVAHALARLVAPSVGGALVALVLARAFSSMALAADVEGLLEGTAPSSVVELIGAFPAFALAALALVIALGSLSSLLWSVVSLRLIRVLPPRAIGAALAAGAVFLLAIGLAVVGQVEVAIVTATGAFVLWDIGEYADGVRTELGRDAATTRAELVHVGGAALTGAVVAGATVACYRWVATDVAIADPAYAAIAVGSGLFAVVLVAWALRG